MGIGLTNNYIPRKIQLDYEREQEQIRDSFDIIFEHISELKDRISYLANLSSLVLSALTASNRLLMSKGIISSNEYEVEIEKLKKQTNELKDKINDEAELIKYYNEFEDPIIDVYTDNIFVDYNDEEIADA